MRRSAGALLVLAACFTPVTEKQCDDRSPCGSGWVCVAGECFPPDGGAGGGGGGAGGGSPVCGGCRDATGACWPGGTEAHCGDVGRICQTCSASQKCVNGACLNASCTAANCPGCCVGSQCVPLTAQTPANCGTGAAACQTCPLNQQCRTGACVPPCSATTCFNGCCDATGGCVPYNLQSPAQCGAYGVACVTCAAGLRCDVGICPSTTCSGCFGGGLCQPGLSDTQCGHGGQTCFSCGPGAKCIEQRCVPNATKVGDACLTDADCSAVGAGVTCRQKTAIGLVYPGGYCTRGCADAGTACPSGALCTNGVALGGESVGFCGASCADAGMCRPGYVCRAVQSLGNICFMNRADGGF